MTRHRVRFLAGAGALLVAAAIAGCGSNPILGSRDSASPSDASDVVRNEVGSDSVADGADTAPGDEGPADGAGDARDEGATDDGLADSADAMSADADADAGDLDAMTIEGGLGVDGGDGAAPDASDGAMSSEAGGEEASVTEAGAGEAGFEGGVLPPDVTIVCAEGTTRCGLFCVSTQSDPSNCGMCGNACTGGRACVGGACACPMGTMACGASCIDTQSDPSNCGACGNACAAGQACVMGACACAAGTTSCGSGAMAACVNTQSDAANCGMCGRACRTGEACVMGACACAAGTTMCGSGATAACVNTGSDATNCGMCGNACGAGQSCVMGSCQCAAGQTRCGTGASSTCVNTQTDNGNCGACGNACSGGASCVMGTCQCPAGTTMCGTGAGATCVNTLSDRAHCGACGNACPGSQLCTAGICSLVCAPPNTLCGTGASQVCTNTLVDDRNCGSCGTACGTVPNSFGGVCTLGSCRPICAMGFANCNTTYSDGCEVNSNTDVNNCGSCGMRCPSALPQASSVACVGGSCAPVCVMGRGNCDGNNANGCETDTTSSLAHCGGCMMACPAAAVACVNSACVFATPINVPAGMTQTINQVAVPIVAAVDGTNTVTVANTMGLLIGQKVLLHQTTGANAGFYETQRITNIVGPVVTLDGPVNLAYTPGAQMVVVYEATTVTVAAGGTLTAPAWNGSTGGILAIESQGAVSIAGALDMSARGFRGGNSNITCATTPRAAMTCLGGVQGESTLGVGTRARSRNGAGGGGGSQGQDCGNGSGGAYGTVGTDGPFPTVGGDTPGTCATMVTSEGGSVIGSSVLVQGAGRLFFGGGGGEGGFDEDGFRAGPGGNGGGIVYLVAPSISVSASGVIASNGGRGDDGLQSFMCPSGNVGGGCGMSGGGGGAGGAILLDTPNLSLASGGTGSRVSAVGGTGGVCTCGNSRRPQVPGGNGRTAIRTATMVTGTGTATPAFATN